MLLIYADDEDLRPRRAVLSNGRVVVIICRVEFREEMFAILLSGSADRRVVFEVLFPSLTPSLDTTPGASYMILCTPITTLSQ